MNKLLQLEQEAQESLGIVTKARHAHCIGMETRVWFGFYRQVVGETGGCTCVKARGRLAVGKVQLQGACHVLKVVCAVLQLADAT